MRLELGSTVRCSDGPFGELADVVIDPTTRRLTHLVVQPKRRHWLARLVPIELVERGDPEPREISLRATAEDVRRFEPVWELSYLRLSEAPLEDPDWDVGTEEVLALPYYEPISLDPLAPADEPYVALAYDRVPKGEVEIRRGSDVVSADGQRVGHVDGLIVDQDEQITHLVLERGHLWGRRREVTIPIGVIVRVATDRVTLRLTKDEVGALRPVCPQRWTR